MPRSAARVVLVAGSAVALLVLARGLFHGRSSSPAPGVASPAARGQNVPPAPSASPTADADRNLPDALPPDHQWGIAPPTAPWMTGAPNPILADAVLDDRRQTVEEVTPGGGLIRVGGERAQFTLYVPRGALLMNQELRVMAVREAAGLPFAAGNIAAVEIGPPGVTFLKPVSLTIEPRRKIPDPAAPSVFGLASHGRPREWHLYPSIDSSQTTGRFVQHLHQFAIAVPGTYGIVEATDAEVRAASERVPSDFMSRIEVEMTKLSFGKSNAPVASAREWGLFAVALAQTSEDQQRKELIASLVQRLRDMYDQDLMPKLQKFRPGCSASAVLESRALHMEVLSWIKAVHLLGLTDDEPRTDPEMERLRESMPITYQLLEQERAANDAYFGPIIRDFEERQDRLWAAFWNLVKEMYAATLECCKTKPRPWMPQQLMSYQRLAEASGHADILGGSSVLDVQQCGCAVSAVYHGQGWQGSITYAYTASGEQNRNVASSASRTQSSSTHTTYNASIVLAGVDEENQLLAFASANGDTEETAGTVDNSGVGCRINENGVSTKTSGVSVGVTRVGVNFSTNQRGYEVTYSTPVAFGLSKVNSWYRQLQCDNPFANRQRNDWSYRPAGVTGGGSQPIRGETDNQLKLQGSRTVALPGSPEERHRTITIQWDLQACQGQ